MRHLPILLAASLLAACARGGEPKPVPNDEQDVVFLQAGRPYRLRLHQQIDGQSFQHQWNDIFLRLFAFLDQDGDGVLSAQELEHAPSANQLRAMIQGASELEADEPPKIADVTDNPAAGVTPLQLRGYYHRVGLAPWQAEWAHRTSATEVFDEELCKHLGGAEKLTRRPIEKRRQHLVQTRSRQ